MNFEMNKWFINEMFYKYNLLFNLRDLSFDYWLSFKDIHCILESRDYRFNANFFFIQNKIIIAIYSIK